MPERNAEKETQVYGSYAHFNIVQFLSKTIFRKTQEKC